MFVCGCVCVGVVWVSNRDLFLLSQFSDFLVNDSVSGLLESTKYYAL